MAKASTSEFMFEEQNAEPMYPWETNWTLTIDNRWMWHRRGTIEMWEFSHYASGENVGKSVWQVFKSNQQVSHDTGKRSFDLLYEALLPDGVRPPAY